MYMYMYPPTPALAMAGAAPGTTFGVDLGFFPIYAPTASIAIAFRFLSLQPLRGTTSIVPLRNCPTHRSESAGHTPPWPHRTLQTLRSSAYGFIYLRTPMYGNFCAKSDFGRIFRFRSLKQLSAEFHHWRPISAELIVECLPPQ